LLKTLYDEKHLLYVNDALVMINCGCLLDSLELEVVEGRIVTLSLFAPHGRRRGLCRMTDHLPGDKTCGIARQMQGITIRGGGHCSQRDSRGQHMRSHDPNFDVCI
jgi:hypothetical protein